MTVGIADELARNADAVFLAELDERVEWDVEAEAESRERARRVEAELSALKERHKKAPDSAG
jgi:FKBP-type peptidyl-prolyl cis-trans isomerase (trigger factor)